MHGPQSNRACEGVYEQHERCLVQPIHSRLEQPQQQARSEHQHPRSLKLLRELVQEVSTAEDGGGQAEVGSKPLCVTQRLRGTVHHNQQVLPWVLGRGMAQHRVGDGAQAQACGRTGVGSARAGGRQQPDLRLQQQAGGGGGWRQAGHA
jgi:hypothetical protein